MIVPAGEYCYYFAPRSVQFNWSQSLDACQQMYQHPTDRSSSSDLASIHDQLENDFIFSQMGVDQYSRWIGLHEDFDRATFFWSDNTPYNFNYWARGEPLMHGQVMGKFDEEEPYIIFFSVIFYWQPECIHIFGETNYGDGRWNDLVCEAKAGYVCKMKRGNERDLSLITGDTFLVVVRTIVNCKN